MTGRRLTLATILVTNHVTTQMLAYRLLMVFMLIYVGQAKASWTFKLEMTHEFLLLTQAVLMPIFTDFVPDPHARLQVGWVSAGFFSAQVTLSLLVVLRLTFKSIKLNIKRCCSKIKHRKQMKSAKKRALQVDPTQDTVKKIVAAPSVSSEDFSSLESLEIAYAEGRLRVIEHPIEQTEENPKVI